MAKTELDLNELSQAAGGAAGTYGVYIVKRGETLSDIARKFHTNVPTLVALNSELIDDPDFIRHGWKLIVPEQK